MTYHTLPLFSLQPETKEIPLTRGFVAIVDAADYDWLMQGLWRVSKEKFTEYLNKGEIMSFTHIPSASEERWYGYRKQDIETIWKRGKLPVVITEMHLLRQLAEHYGRRSILSFGLLPPGKSKRAMLSALLHRLRIRGRDAEEHIKDRLKNAAKDLEFFRERADLFDRILVNDDLQMVVETVRQHLPSPAGQE